MGRDAGGGKVLLESQRIMPTMSKMRDLSELIDVADMLDLSDLLGEVLSCGPCLFRN